MVQVVAGEPWLSDEMLTFSNASKWAVYWQAVSLIRLLSSNFCFYSRDPVVKLWAFFSMEGSLLLLAINYQLGYNYCSYIWEVYPVRYIVAVLNLFWGHEICWESDRRYGSWIRKWKFAHLHEVLCDIYRYSPPPAFYICKLV